MYHTAHGATPDSAPAPPQLDGYEYRGILGSGSTATVYRYLQHGTNREVAVKVSTARLDPKAGARFRTEANFMAKLSAHPYILSIYGAGITADGRSYIVFEYAPGGNLKDLLATRRFDAEETLDIGVNLASALATAHRNGIVHRDIKTSNVLITEQGLPALADFGISASVYDKRSTGFSLPWAPPEGARLQRLGHRRERHLLARRHAVCDARGALAVRTRLPPAHDAGARRAYHERSGAAAEPPRRAGAGGARARQGDEPQPRGPLLFRRRVRARHAAGADRLLRPCHAADGGRRGPLRQGRAAAPWRAHRHHGHRRHRQARPLARRVDRDRRRRGRGGRRCGIVLHTCAAEPRPCGQRRGASGESGIRRRPRQAPARSPPSAPPCPPPPTWWAGTAAIP